MRPARPSLAHRRPATLPLGAQCEHKPSGLDHDILLVGYGTYPEGDYW